MRINTTILIMRSILATTTVSCVVLLFVVAVSSYDPEAQARPEENPIETILGDIGGNPGGGLPGGNPDPGYDPPSDCAAQDPVNCCDKFMEIPVCDLACDDCCWEKQPGMSDTTSWWRDIEQGEAGWKNWTSVDPPQRNCYYRYKYCEGDQCKEGNVYPGGCPSYFPVGNPDCSSLE